MRIAVFGAGRIGSHHAATLSRSDAVDEVLVADVDAVRAEAVAHDLGATAVSVDEAFAASPDGVVIATPTALHAELIIRAVDAGRPAFCEKPVAETLGSTLAVVEHVERSGVPVQIGFQRRFDAGYAAVREAIASGAIGELRRLHLVTCDPTPPPADYLPLSGGLYRDCHIHDFDVLRFVTDREVASVTAMGAARGSVMFDDADDVSESVALLQLDDGTLVTMQGSRYNGAGYDVRLEAAGTEGTWVAGLTERAPLHNAEPATDFPGPDPWPGFLERFAAAYTVELECFLDVVGGGSAPICTPRDALEALYVAEAADAARREGRTVTIDEVRGS